jgi:hypothetical protein
LRPTTAAAAAACTIERAARQAGPARACRAAVKKNQESELNKDEIVRLQSYLRKTLGAPSLEVRAQAKKGDMAEVFIRGKFVATLYRIVDDGEVEYQFQMAILEMDLEGA